MHLTEWKIFHFDSFINFIDYLRAHLVNIIPVMDRASLSVVCFPVFAFSICVILPCVLCECCDNPVSLTILHPIPNFSLYAS